MNQILKLKPILDYNTYTNQNRSHWSKGAEAKRNETTYVWGACIEQGLKPCLKPVKIGLKWYLKDRRKDIDNVRSALKFILDGMVKAKVFPNDGMRWVRGIAFEEFIMASDLHSPGVDVYIEEWVEILNDSEIALTSSKDGTVRGYMSVTIEDERTVEKGNLFMHTNGNAVTLSQIYNPNETANTISLNSGEFYDLGPLWSEMFEEHKNLRIRMKDRQRHMLPTQEDIAKIEAKQRRKIIKTVASPSKKVLASRE